MAVVVDVIGIGAIYLKGLRAAPVLNLALVVRVLNQRSKRVHGFTRSTCIFKSRERQNDKTRDEETERERERFPSILPSYIILYTGCVCGNLRIRRVTNTHAHVFILLYFRHSRTRTKANQKFTSQLYACIMHIIILLYPSHLHVREHAFFHFSWLSIGVRSPPPPNHLLFIAPKVIFAMSYEHGAASIYLFQQTIYKNYRNS